MKHALISLFLVLFSGLAFGTSYTKTDNVISSSGGPVGFPAGITVPTTQVGDISASTASLTLTAGTNVAAVVTPVTLKYSRNGNHVCTFGQVSIDPTAGSSADTAFTLTLPVLRSANFAGTLGAYGTAAAPAAIAAGSCVATNAAKTVTCHYPAGGTAVELVGVQFCYGVTGD